MPKYRYDGNKDAIMNGGVRFPQGAVVNTSGYHQATGLTLVSHYPEKKPIKVLHNGTIPSTAVQVDPDYSKLVVVNYSGAVLNVYANADKNNVLPIASNYSWVFDNVQRDIGSLTFSGSGSNNIQVVVSK